MRQTFQLVYLITVLGIADGVLYHYILQVEKDYKVSVLTFISSASPQIYLLSAEQSN